MWSPWFGSNAVRLIVAFGTGAVLTAGIAASWTAPQVAQSAPDAPAKAEAAAPGSAAASTATQTAQHRPCDRQAWPYIEQRCRDEDNAASAKARHHVRIVSPDRRTPLSVMGSTKIGSARAGTAGSAAGAATPQPETGQNAIDIATGSVPLPPERPHQAQADAVSSPVQTVSVTGTTEQKEARKRPPSRTGRDDPQDRSEPRTPRRQASAARRERETAAGRADWRLDRNDRQRDRWREDRQDEPKTIERPRRGEVTVVQTFNMPNGRRITVKKVYRKARHADDDYARHADDDYARRADDRYAQRADLGEARWGEDDEADEEPVYRESAPHAGYYIVRRRGFLSEY